MESERCIPSARTTFRSSLDFFVALSFHLSLDGRAIPGPIPLQLLALIPAGNCFASSSEADA